MPVNELAGLSNCSVIERVVSGMVMASFPGHAHMFFDPSATTNRR